MYYGHEHSGQFIILYSTCPPREARQIMRHSHEDRQYTENTISTRGNQRATVTHCRVMSTCRKRYMRNTTSNSQQHRKPGNKATLQTIHTMCSLSRKIGSYQRLYDFAEARLRIRLNNQQGQQGHTMTTPVSSDKSIEYTFNGIVQIGDR